MSSSAKLPERPCALGIGYRQKEQATGAWFDIVPEERGKTWINKRTEVFDLREELNNPHAVKTAPEGYEWDKDSGVRNCKDHRPSLFHDIGYDEQVWDDGTPMKRSDVDKGYKILIERSPYIEDHSIAERNYKGVKWIGWPFWLKCKFVNWVKRLVKKEAQDARSS